MGSIKNIFTDTKLKPIPIDKFKGSVRNRVYRVGLEFEGGWAKLPDGVELTHDGSVGVRSTDGTPLAIGELVSTPMEPATIPVWMKRSYPTAVNNSCGLHIHTSFKSAKHYQQLMIPEFPLTVLFYLAKWGEKEGIPKGHHFWERIKGENRYCRGSFFADLQAQKSDKSHNMDHEGHRYTVINYCWGLHETMECRVLPMFETVAQSIRAVEEYLDIVNASLAATAKKEVKRKILVDLKPGEDRYVEKRHVRV